jgi:hypothetical protein
MASEHYKKTATRNSYLRLNRSESVFYCRHCHEQSDIVVGMAWRNGKPVTEIRNVDILCPHCSKLSEDKDIIDAGGKEITHLYSHISYFDNGDTVRAYIYSKEISFFSRKLQQQQIRTMVVFNIKTGQTYLFEPRYEKSKKRWKHYGGPRLKNISISSYAGLLMSFKLEENDPKVQGLMDLLQAKLQEKFPYPVKSLRAYGLEHNAKKHSEKRLSLAILANYIRLPHLNSYDFNQFIEDNRYMYEDKKFAYILRKARPDTANPIGDLVRAFKGPDAKSIRKLIMKNLDYLSRLYMFQDFKDVNNVRRLLEKSDDWRRGYNGYYDEKLPIFIKAMLKKAPETVVANKILKIDHLYLLSDTARMYYDIIEINSEYDFDISRSLRDLHDIFSMDYNKLQHPNLPLEYTKQELKIECDIDGYEFRLAKETHELITVGAKMDICVGSYGNRAHRKELNICVAYKDNEPVVCFELSRKLDRVLQAKLHGNQRPKDELYELCMEFVNRNEMSIDTYDLHAPEPVDSPFYQEAV